MKALTSTLLTLALLLCSCQDELNIENPNEPQLSNAQTESGIISFAMGGVYVNSTKFSTPPSGFLWRFVIGFHELMGDAIGVEAANFGANQLACPEYLVLDDQTILPNPLSPSNQKDFLRQANLNEFQGSNPVYYEWAFMYGINNACNVTLSLLDKVKFKGDAQTVDIKKKILMAWCYFWKGYSYSRLGSIYYAGIINNEPFKTNGNYVTKEELLEEAEGNFTQAETILNGLTPGEVYNEMLGKLIPNICQVGKGGVLTPEMWKRTINTMRARNILINIPVNAMTPALWDQVLNLTYNGIQAADKVFTVRTNVTGDLMSPLFGNVAALTFGVTAQGGFYKVSERLIQEFKPGDIRLTNNFIKTTAWTGNANRGNSFNTRWALLNGGAGIPGVVVMCNRNAGAYEWYMAGFQEENDLMKAEAMIYLGNIDGGLAVIDQLRAQQGAGLEPVSGTGLSAAQAIMELRSERRVALAFRGFAFYDARRYDVINTGRTGAVVVDFDGNVNTNATIHYNFLDYWDVPDNELVYNPPLPNSAQVKNPNGL